MIFGKLLDLSFNFIINSVHDAGERGDIFDFNEGCIKFVVNTDIDSGLAAHTPLFDISVGNTDVSDNLLEFSKIFFGLFGRNQIRFGNNFDQWYSRAVEIEKGGTIFMDRLAGILFHVCPIDTDVMTVDSKMTINSKRFLKLSYLIAFSKVGIKIIFSFKKRIFVDSTVQGKT